ncbi:cation diffusion facilitator family transporter [Zhouia sp. PK063]|uniref:cation diffusion facilitator family transporter n=1 Tax=Zhouia sp. PK063 TaxID=3373602 RepID=UPI0037B6B0CD
MQESLSKNAIKTTYISIIGNFFLAIIKGIAGICGHSYALVADAIESTADIFSSIFVLFGLKYAQRPADENHPYGHSRVEPLITFIITGFLIVSATIIAYESIHNIRNPHKMPEGWTLIVLGVIIVWKELSYQFVIRKSRETNSSALKADAWHHRSDAITSATAFIGISIALIFGKGFETADDWAALFASGFILYNCYHIFRPALGEIMDENLHTDQIEIIREVANQVPGILGTEKCYVRKAGMFYHVDLHAIVDGSITVTKGHALSHRLEDEIRKNLFSVGSIIIHIEPDHENIDVLNNF